MSGEELLGLLGDAPQVVTDSREAGPGKVFFALRGERFDGNRFVSAALRAGARLAVADGRGAAEADPCVRGCGRVVYVPDALKALQDAAAAYRVRLGIPVLAVTGSNGKTTTKELTAAVLSRRLRTAATQGNLNNHIGVPLTLLAIRPDAEAAVVEMGASARGEIALLCRIARPDYGIITNIGRAHLEGFGGPEGVKTGKGELYDRLAGAGGTALVCSGDETLCGMARERGVKAVYYDPEPGPEYATALDGDYNRRNVAAAVAAGRLFGVPDGDIRAALAAYAPRNHRSQVEDTGRNVVIMDCYNANPSSMAAALDNFFGGRSERARGVILGDMLELGEWSAEEHRRVVSRALEGRPARLWLVGPEMGRACRELGAEGREGVTLCADCAALCEALVAERPRGYRILVKGSRGMALEMAAGLL